MYNSHICVFGSTSSGKTYWSGYMFRQMPNWNIFFNTQAEPALSRDFGGYEVSGIEDFTEALTEGHRRRIVYTPESETIAEQQEEISEIIDILYGIGKIMNAAGRRHIWCHLYIDEVHLLSSKKSPFSMVDRIATQGKRYGVVGVFISQRPALVSQTLITQSDSQVIFRCNSYEIPYFERYGFPISEYKIWLARPYHYIIDNGVRIGKMNPITV